VLDTVKRVQSLILIGQFVFTPVRPGHASVLGVNGGCKANVFSRHDGVTACS